MPFFLAFKIVTSQFWKPYMRTQKLLPQSYPQIRRHISRHYRWPFVLWKNLSAMFFDFISLTLLHTFGLPPSPPRRS